MDYLEIIGTLIGLLYLWLEYHASIFLWITGIIMPAVYIVVYYKAGLYADFGINIYYLIAAIYGWLVWSRGNPQNAKADLPIAHAPFKIYMPCLIIFLTAFVLIAWILINFTNSNVPWLDSFTTSLSFIAMWMLAKKYVEQWILWISVDAVSCGLYVYKELYFTSVLYGLYSIIAIFGYIKWLKSIHNEKSELI